MADPSGPKTGWTLQPRFEASKRRRLVSWRRKTLMKRKRSRPGKTKIPTQRSSAPGAGSDDPNELKEFVQNYLVLADQALGFMRRQGPNRQLTISTCVHCQHTIAASNLELLSFVENLHVCPAKQCLVAGRKDAA